MKLSLLLDGKPSHTKYTTFFHATLHEFSNLHAHICRLINASHSKIGNFTNIIMILTGILSDLPHTHTYRLYSQNCDGAHTFLSWSGSPCYLPSIL